MKVRGDDNSSHGIFLGVISLLALIAFVVTAYMTTQS